MSTPESSKSFLDKAKAAAANVAANTKAAAQIAAKQAEHGKINKMTLPNAYWALGKDIHGAGRFRDEFKDLYAKVDAILSKIQTLRQAAPPPLPGQQQKITDRAKAAAGHAADLAKAKAAEMEANGVLRELGKRAYEKHGAQAGSPQVTQPIAQALARLQTLEREIQDISQAHSGGFLTPKRLLVGGGIVVAALLLFFVSRLFTGGGPPSTSVAKNRVESSAADSRSPTSPDDGQQVSDSSDSIVQDEASTFAAIVQPYPHSPLAVPDEGQQAKSTAILPKATLKPETTFSLTFSPNGAFLATYGDLSAAFQIWDTTTWKEKKATSADSNSFNYPGTFSPDGTMLACVDGEFVRIWTLTTPTASLRFSAPIGEGSKTNMMWCRNGIVAVICENKAFLFRTKEPQGQGFESFGEIKALKAICPDGTMMCRFGEESKLSILSVPDGKEVAELDLPRSLWEERTDADIGGSADEFHFAPKKNTLIACYPRRRNDTTLGAIVLFDISTRKQRAIIRMSDIASPTGAGSLSDCKFCGFSPDQRLLLTRATIGLQLANRIKNEHYLVLWDTESGKKVHQLAVDSAEKAALAEGQDILAIGGSIPAQDSHSNLWNVASVIQADPNGGKCALRLLIGHREQCIMMAANPTDSAIKDYGSNDLDSLAISPNGKWLATGHRVDSVAEVRIWDVESAAAGKLPSATRLPTKPRAGSQHDTPEDLASRVQDLEQGASEADVQSLLGKPKEVRSVSGVPGAVLWVYDTSPKVSIVLKTSPGSRKRGVTMYNIDGKAYMPKGFGGSSQPVPVDK